MLRPFIVKVSVLGLFPYACIMLIDNLITSLEIYIPTKYIENILSLFLTWNVRFNYFNK